MTTTPEAQPPAAESPAVQVVAQTGSPLERAQLLYPELKAQAEAAAKAFKDCTDVIKLELSAAAPGQPRVDLAGANGCPTLQLDYRESWRIDSKRLKAEQPVLYVTYAKKSGSWYLNPAKADGSGS